MIMRKHRSWPLLAVAALFTVTSCAGEAPSQAGHPDNYVCHISAESTEAELLLQVIRGETFTDRIGNRAPDFVEKMQINLRGYPENRITQPLRQCEYFPNGQHGNGQASIEYSWVPLADAESDKDPDTRRYRWAGATGKSHDVSTDIYVQCDMPGDLNARSKKFLLRAEASFTVNLGTVKDHGTQDQQMEFLYYMTRKATDVLGCENKPLAKEPVVKPRTESTS
ncbi:hypothetical protein [Streptomyces sp. NPDC026092]|uniref:hypothetical protein n=1 Tax=Streptomyces sp. NPDC026092 TaxID=3154797 RepID=UPI0033CF0A12